MTLTAFETWIAAPPYEFDVTRYPDDPLRTAWPGQYTHGTVQTAWEAWSEAWRQKGEEGAKA